MDDARIIALACVLVAWWIVSACNQFHSGALTQRLRRHIPLGLIPRWTFFAPNPARADSRLVWREEHAGAWTAWQELHFGFAPASTRWLVNPTLILNKAVSDLTAAVLRLEPRMAERTPLLSATYLTLLSIVLDQAAPHNCSAVQFAVVRTSKSSGDRQLEVVFVSEIHASAEVAVVRAS